MPSWKHVLFDDNENRAFVEKHFPEYIDFYTKLKFPIQRADFIRYCFLYVNGGEEEEGQGGQGGQGGKEDETETEAKVYLLKAPQNFAGHFTNFFMASTARNPFWLIVLRECVEKLPPWVILPHNIISEQTGLACISRAVKKAKNENLMTIEILPFENLVPCDVCSTASEYERRPYYYTKFLKGGSWTFFIYLTQNYPDGLYNFLYLTQGGAGPRIRNQRTLWRPSREAVWR
jgi:mannosyltransferase OCH1-like enzyme